MNNTRILNYFYNNFDSFIKISYKVRIEFKFYFGKRFFFVFILNKIILTFHLPRIFVTIKIGINIEKTKKINSISINIFE